MVLAEKTSIAPMEVRALVSEDVNSEGKEEAQGAMKKLKYLFLALRSFEIKPLVCSSLTG